MHSITQREIYMKVPSNVHVPTQERTKEQHRFSVPAHTCTTHKNVFLNSTLRVALGTLHIYILHVNYMYVTLFSFIKKKKSLFLIYLKK